MPPVEAARLVASIEFLDWTTENRLWHPEFVTLRVDWEPPKSSANI